MCVYMHVDMNVFRPEREKVTKELDTKVPFYSHSQSTLPGGGVEKL